MTTYSFLDVVAAIAGPGGATPLASGAGAAEEGITVEPVADQNTMTIGAGGEGMHSLSANTASTVTVRLLKTSPVNAVLQAMFDFQTLSSRFHGKNTITISNTASGDVIVLAAAAFKKRPTINYAKEGGTIEWLFDAVKTGQVLGVGVPEL